MIWFKYYLRKVFNVLGLEVTRFPKSAAQMKWLRDLNIKNVVDIGANLGQFSLNVLTVLPESKLFCFEPLPSEFLSLKRKLSKYPNVKFYNYALGNKVGKTNFQKSAFSPSSSMMKMSDDHKKNFPFTAATNNIEIQIERLDNFFSEINPNDDTLIKIDVQGFEHEVISGGESIIRKSKVVIMETSFIELYNGQELFENLYNRMKLFSYKFKGSFNISYSPINGGILQADSIFIKD